MVTSIKCLKTEIDSRLAAGGLSALASCQLLNACRTLDATIVYKVPTCAALPSITANQGRWVYLEDVCEYRYSNGYEWTSDVTTTFSALGGLVCTYGWGNGFSGQIGDNSITSSFYPVTTTPGIANWCKVASGTQTTAAIKTDNTLWWWGNDNQVTIAICYSSPIREATSSTNWLTVSAGNIHLAAIKSDGTSWSWGCAGYGRLGNNSTQNTTTPQREASVSTDWCAISAGTAHSVAIKTGGTLWSWGFFNFGALGDNTTISRSSPVRETSLSTDWCAASAGYNMSTAIKTGGTLWAWGFNTCGTLGINTILLRSSPVREVSLSTTWCETAALGQSIGALKTDNSLWTWGSGQCGVLALNNIANLSSPVREITSSSDWCCITGALRTAAAIKTTGQLWGWGNNASGQLGDNSTLVRSSPVREFCSLTTWLDVSRGTNNTIALAVGKGFI